MNRRISPQSREIQGTLRALRRAARKALELGLTTGTPVYVMKDGKIIDLTKDKAVVSKLQSKRQKRR